MKINKIILKNFGSYEGTTVFDTPSNNEKNIVLFGGKNGAGKTTLFTAIRVCLYGYMSMGYRNKNAYYSRAITKLINNTAKLSRPAEAAVEMDIAISNGHDMDLFHLSREWCLSDSLVEVFSISKNGSPLSEDAIADFEKYLLSLIPPELFNLYFFDGERIADFFLNEGSNTRIKEAFLTLCGYDTFDIMRKNFRRISNNTQNVTPELEEYVASKREYEQAQKQLQELIQQLAHCTDGIAACDADLTALEREYKQKGGISQEEWAEKIYALKEEEKKRENWNAYLKRCANDIVPFIMIRDLVNRVKGQIEQENNDIKYHHFSEVINQPEIAALIGSHIRQIQQIAQKQFGSSSEAILALSFEQSAAVIAQINTIIEFDKSKIIKCKSLIKKSIQKSADIRAELENSSVSSVQEYMKRRSELFEQKSNLLQDQVALENSISELKNTVRDSEIQYNRARTKLEEELKRASIKNISAKAIVMLDKLMQVLYRKQIAKVEELFRHEIALLMRKKHFIDDISIDDDFNVHLYRSEAISIEKIINMAYNHSESEFAELIGIAAMQKLTLLAGGSEQISIVNFLNTLQESTIVLPFEIDKTALSNGEKQVFIMALYHALVQLGNHEIPFIIDTPFARIDTEHRRNISQYFFSRLKGQVFILSTNEEIDAQHVQMMKEKITATYLLENTDNKRTTVIQNSYFEV